MDKVLDISSFQPSITWAAVVASGVKAVYAKATEGATWTDSTFLNHVKGAQSAGLPVGAYHFAHPETNDAVTEAKHFISVLQTANTNLMPMLDLESPNKRGKLTGAQIATWARTFIDYVESQTNRKVLLYTGTWYVDTYSLHGLGDLPLWIAEYGVSAPKQCGDWTEYLMWQYTDSASVNGITGNVDLSYVSSVQALKGNYSKGDMRPMSATLQLNATGNVVKQLQTDLNTVLGVSLAVDGDFGAATEAAVKSFQQIAGLTVDGIAGTATMAALQEYLKKKAPKYDAVTVEINGVKQSDGIAVNGVTYVNWGALDVVKAQYTNKGHGVFSVNGKDVNAVIFNNVSYLPWNAAMPGYTVNKINGGFNFVAPAPKPVEPAPQPTPSVPSPSVNTQNVQQAVDLLEQAINLLRSVK